MKKGQILRAAFVGLLAVVNMASAAIEFAGYVVTSNGARFTLIDTEKNASSAWLSVGQIFAGQTLSAFDQEKEILTVTGLNGPAQLSLRPSVVKAAKMAVSGTVEFGVGQRIEVVRASLIVGEHNRMLLKEGVILNVRPVLMDDGNMKYFVLLEKESPDGRKQVTAWPTLISPPGKPFGLSVGDLKFSFKPRG